MFWQFISNSNSSNTKYFYDWPISNSSKTPINNYFLTVRTKEEFTVQICEAFRLIPILFDCDISGIRNMMLLKVGSFYCILNGLSSYDNVT